MNTELTESDIMKMNIEELYNTLILLKEEEDLEEYEEEIEAIEQGINIEIPIIYLTNEWYEPYPSNKRVKILGYGKVNIEEFYEEKLAREAKMRRIIIENLGDEHPAEPR